MISDCSCFTKIEEIIRVKRLLGTIADIYVCTSQRDRSFDLIIIKRFILMQIKASSYDV